MRTKEICLIITNRCNFNCKFCMREKDNAELSLEQLRNILIQAREFGFNCISLTGGEPCLHTRFYEMIDLIARMGFYFRIISNSFEWEKYKPLLKYGTKFLNIDFSLDGNEKTHNFLRRQGSFKQVIEALRFFSGKKETSIILTLNRYNINSVYDVFLIAKKHNASLKIWKTFFTGKNAEYIPNQKNLYDVWEIKQRLRKRADYGEVVKAFEVFYYDFVCDLWKDISLTINPLNQVIFCCDNVGNGLVIADLNKVSLKEALMKYLFIQKEVKQKYAETLTEHQGLCPVHKCELCNKISSAVINNLKNPGFL